MTSVLIRLKNVSLNIPDVQLELLRHKNINRKNKHDLTGKRVTTFLYNNVNIKEQANITVLYIKCKHIVSNVTNHTSHQIGRFFNDLFSRNLKKPHTYFQKKISISTNKSVIVGQVTKL